MQRWLMSRWLIEQLKSRLKQRFRRRLNVIRLQLRLKVPKYKHPLIASKIQTRRMSLLPVELI